MDSKDARGMQSPFYDVDPIIHAFKACYMQLVWSRYVDMCDK